MTPRLLILYPLKIHLCRFLGANFQVILMILIAVNFYRTFRHYFDGRLLQWKWKRRHVFAKLIFKKFKRNLLTTQKMLYGIRRLKLKLILLLFSCFSIVIHLNFDFVSSRFHRNIKKVIVDPERPTKKAKLVIQHIFFDEHPINYNNNKCYLARVISSA